MLVSEAPLCRAAMVADPVLKSSFVDFNDELNAILL